MEPVPDPRLVAAVASRIDAALAASGALLVVGICGAQGSGKSTLAAHLAGQLADRGLRVATLSLDDLYQTRAERMRLAAQVHPLLATRGVPGTHDVALGLATLDALARGEPAPLPRFDKAADDRVPADAWPLAPAGTQVLLLEGWCLGARPQADVSDPVNAFEAAEDPNAVWRSYANTALAGDYQQLFARIDLLVLLAAPGWDIVAQWREQQEAELRAGGGARVMSPAEVTRFIQHYERLTRWILEEMPTRADLTVRLGENREVLSL
ncbi:MAG: division plane positioning ATPase MipZ [Novosphingobium sp.]